MIRLFVIFVVSCFVHIFYRHRVYGKKNFPKGSGIICANHNSFLDPPLIGISAPGEVHFLGRDTLFKNTFFAWLIRKLNTHPVKRGENNIYAFKKAIELVQCGDKVVIFPEGSRSATGHLNPGKAGVAILVQRTGCRVIPMYIYGSYDVWSSHRKFPKIFGKTACVIGSPIDFSGIDSCEKKEMQKVIVDLIMDKISQLERWYLAGAKGLPP